MSGDLNSVDQQASGLVGACDCHAHIFGPEQIYPMSPSRPYTPEEASIPDYQRTLAQIGFDRAVIVQPTVYGVDNRRTIDAVAELGADRTRAIAVVDEQISDAELKSYNVRGVRGIRYITAVPGRNPTLEQMPIMARRIADLGWHIALWPSPASLPDLKSTIRSLPVDVIFDHMAQLSVDTKENDPQLSAVLELLDTGKLWIKLSGYRLSKERPPYRDVGRIARLLLRHAPERCLWGTDWPHVLPPKDMPTDSELLAALGEWCDDPATYEKVLCSNPNRLYGFTLAKTA
jgi:predicted TIM-barrel fold metal-dependent hydrolase